MFKKKHCFFKRLDFLFFFFFEATSLCGAGHGVSLDWGVSSTACGVAGSEQRGLGNGGRRTGLQGRTHIGIACGENNEAC